MALSLTTKVAIITGSAGGLGRVIAEKFLQAGAQVVLVDINEERLQVTKTELLAFGQVHSVKADIVREEEVQKVFDEAIDQFGKVDILVNNAGIMDQFDAVGALDKELWDRVIAVNLTAPFLMSKCAINQFEKLDPPGGVILNVASIGGLFGARAGIYSTHGNKF
jgi:NAD(P)-dependent dehydrogenase (short-subunit alcohol dehydrogenase family)